ncbi:ATP-NAD kinase family protein [Halocatena pleomorpha]|uniref:N-acetylglucosamine-1-phosphate uridyltransferase n=1 Tax=Halocatena pleomorpha TaxID=1785090 RepID=A0A3P3RBJ2_9EURY|nr:ATP-NAD kinase family protein [Halocatena pleomorpha]RRJ30329.1 N-acetylglucosamine-1-phosphate uridyltransferase [Halocatena pleomorpha]
MRHIGVVVNPIAGMGGRVGLKGTDGKVEQARERGAEPRAPERARTALESLGSHASDLRITTVGGEMGAAAVRAALDDIAPTVVAHPPDATTAKDTRQAVAAFLDRGVDLVLFVGGDGTAVDVAETITAAGNDTPMLGVPAGVKIYSSVFAVTPRAAGRIGATYDRTEQREVNDINEERYRSGEVHPELRAVVSVPVGEDVQPSKQQGGGSVDNLAAGFMADVDPKTTYVFGPGSTVGTIEGRLGIDGSPLGVDVWRAGESSDELLVRDGSEAEILDALGEHNAVVVSPIGGQGFVFGRGNQQLSPAVIRRSEVIVVASNAKLNDLGVLRVDTDDPDLDAELRGWQKVRVGRFEHRLLEIV